MRTSQPRAVLQTDCKQRLKIYNKVFILNQ